MILGFTNFVSFIHLTCFCKIIFYSKVLSTLSSSLIFQEHSGILSFSTFQVAIRFAHYCILNLSADLYGKVPNVMNPLSCNIISSKTSNMHLTNNTSKVDIYILKIWCITDYFYPFDIINSMLVVYHTKLLVHSVLQDN